MNHIHTLCILLPPSLPLTTHSQTGPLSPRLPQVLPGTSCTLFATFLVRFGPLCSGFLLFFSLFPLDLLSWQKKPIPSPPKTGSPQAPIPSKIDQKSGKNRPPSDHPYPRIAFRLPFLRVPVGFFSCWFTSSQHDPVPTPKSVSMSTSMPAPCGDAATLWGGWVQRHNGRGKESRWPRSRKSLQVTQL